MTEPDADSPQHLVAFGMPAEERQRLAELVRQGFEQAQPRFAEAARALPTAVDGTDVRTLMGVLTLHFATFEAGTNAEFERPDGVFQHHLEMAQGALLALGGGVIQTQLHSHALTLAESVQEPVIPRSGSSEQSAGSRTRSERSRSSTCDSGARR